MKKLKMMHNVGLYVLASVIPAVFSILINPFVAKNMSPMDYSIVGFYTSFNLLLTPLVSFYFSHYYSKKYYESSDEKKVFLKAVIYRLFFFVSSLIAVFSIVGIALYKVFFNNNSSIPLFPYVFLFVATLFFNCFFMLELNHLKMKREVWAFFLFSMIQTLLIVLSTFLFVIFFKWGAYGKMLAPLVESIVLFVFILYKNRSLLFVHIPFSEFPKILSFCYPIVLTAMLGFFTKGFDCILLERFNNSKEFALYTIGMQFSAYLTLLTNALQNTFQADIYESVAKKNNAKLIKIGLLLFFASVFIVLCFVCFAPSVIDILTYGRYTDAAQYAKIMSISIIFSVMFYFVSTINVAKGKTMILLVNKIVVSIFAIVIIPFMVQHYMYKGGAVCQILVWLFALISLLFFSNINLSKRE